MKEKIRDLFKEYFNDETMPVVELEDMVLALFDVAWRSEQLSLAELWKMAQKYNCDDFIKMVE